MTGSQMSRQLRAAEFNRVAVVQRSVDLGAGASLPCTLCLRNVGVHDHQSRTCVFLDKTHRGVVIAMRVAREVDLRVAIFESERFDALLDERYILGEIRVDQNVSLRRVDQVNSEIRSSDPIQIPCDFERGKLTMPVRILLRQNGRRKYEKHEQNTIDHVHLLLARDYPSLLVF